jgi:hypothetical protein
MHNYKHGAFCKGAHCKGAFDHGAFDSWFSGEARARRIQLSLDFGVLTRSCLPAGTGKNLFATVYL